MRTRVDRRAISRRRRLVPALQTLEPRHLLAFSSELFADINQLGVSSIPDSFVEFKSQLYFVADDGKNGSELWRSDGTSQGTTLVADINPGSGGSLPTNLTVFGNDLYFTALDADDVYDLWKTDGTTQGTVRVFDADAAGVYELDQLTPSGSRLFFTAYQSTTGYELWSTDGTTNGTKLVRDLNPDQTVSEGPLELTDVNGKLFFTSYTNGYDNRELFESDGTLLGTVLVANIDGDPLESSLPRNLTNVNGTLYFAADHPQTGVELYKSTGSTGTTVRVGDVNPGAGSSYPESLTPFAGQLFFSANDGATGRQLFKTDGNTVTLVANTTPGATGSSSPAELTVVGSELYFVANGGAVPGPVSAVSPTLTSTNSFRANGDNFAGLVALRTNAYSGTVTAATTSGSFNLPAQGGTVSDGPGWVSATARIGDVGVGLSGIEIGDFVIRDMDLAADITNANWEWNIQDPAGLSGINFAGFVSGNDFDTFDEAILFELFLNGSATRTSFLEIKGDDLDNWFANRNANNISLTHPGGETITSAKIRMRFRPEGGVDKTPNDAGESIVMRASLSATGQSSGEAGRELHKTNGTVTTLVKDIVVPGSSNPQELTAVNGKLFFTADDPVGSGRELWVSDGSTSGTVMVKDIRTGSDLYGAPLSGDPQSLTSVNGKLFFSAVDGSNDRELWFSDSTPSGTVQAKNIHEGTQDADIQQVVQVGSKLFFVANDGINGEAVWVADLTMGTVAIAADVTASAQDRINGLAKFGTGVIFHNDSLGVYTTNGVTTTPITSATPLPFNSRGEMFLEVGSTVFFVLTDATDGDELWKSNGTAAGTSLVVDLYDGAIGSQPRDLVAFQDKVFFSADSRTPGGTITGRELFRSDGTAGGTQLIFDINRDPDSTQPTAPITLSSDPRSLTVSGSKLYFSAASGTNTTVGNTNVNTGRELWSADGNLGGVSLVRDIRTGTNSSDPINLTDVDGVLYFAANDGTNGNEPFRSEGTSVTTTLVANINGGSASSNPNGFKKSGSQIYFSAFEATTGVELYVTNGVPAGTSRVADLQSGLPSSNPAALAALSDNRLLVAATGSGSLNREFWITGGAISGIVSALEMNPDPVFGSNPTNLIPAGNGFVFIGEDGVHGRELYRLQEIAAVVETEVVGDGTAQRSSIGQFQVTFNTQVTLAGDPFEFVNLTTGQAVADVPTVSLQNGKTVVSFAFTAGNSVNSAGLLLNGDYQLTIKASQVRSLGLALDGDGNGTVGDDYVFGASDVDAFYRKFGDGNGNGTVDLLDFAGFRRTFGALPSNPSWNAAYDNDGDGTVGLLDFAEFRRNFGT